MNLSVPWVPAVRATTFISLVVDVILNVFSKLSKSWVGIDSAARIMSPHMRALRASNFVVVSVVAVLFSAAR